MFVARSLKLWDVEKGQVIRQGLGEHDRRWHLRCIGVRLDLHYAADAYVAYNSE